MNTILSDLLWAFAVLLFLGGCFLGVKSAQKRRDLPPELSRKMVHMAMAVAVLPFPWIFHYRLTVVVLGVLATSGLLYLRLFASKGDELGGVLYRVERLGSVGELVYPAAVVIAYLIAPTREGYVVPILVLGFADSMAALVGTEYAKMQLAVERESPKSFEGAVAFFFSAFVCVVSPLLLFSRLEGPMILLVSLLVAAMSTLLELVCPMGLDNFFIPVLIAVFLNRLTAYTLPSLFLYFLLLMLYAAVALLFARKKNITRLGVVEALLAVLLTTLLGDFFWVVAPLILFFTYSVFPSLSQAERERPLNYHDVENNLIPGLLMLAVGTLFVAPSLLFWVYSTYYACLTAKNHYLRIYNYFPGQGGSSPAAAFARGFLLQIAPGALLYRTAYGAFPTLPHFALASASVLLVLAVSDAVVRRYNFPHISLRLGWISGLISMLFAVGGGIALYFAGG